VGSRLVSERFFLTALDGLLKTWDQVVVYVFKLRLIVFVLERVKER